MIISDEDLLEFFKTKVECTIAQIKKKGLRIATGYRIEMMYPRGRLDNFWVLNANQYQSLHPLDLILENQKVLFDKSKTSAIARRLNCNIDCISSFNSGLRNAQSSIPKKKSLEYKFYSYGQDVRKNHYTRKRKPEVKVQAVAENVAPPEHPWWVDPDGGD